MGRIVDFVALAIVAIRCRPVLKSLAVRPLVMLGQASLPVFCVHLLCVLAVLTMLGDRAVMDGWQAVAAIVATNAVLLLTGIVAAQRRNPRSGGLRVPVSAVADAR